MSENLLWRTCIRLPCPTDRGWSSPSVWSPPLAGRSPCSSGPGSSPAWNIIVKTTFEIAFTWISYLPLNFFVQMLDDIAADIRWEIRFFADNI